MSTQSKSTFNDGFPKKPIDAVEFSYFLSDAEKQEWREWIQTATPEQQSELVDILHSMWQDNQKNAVPESFANQTPISQPVNTNNTKPQQTNFNNPSTNFGQIPTSGILEPITPEPQPLPPQQTNFSFSQDKQGNLNQENQAKNNPSFLETSQNPPISLQKNPTDQTNINPSPFAPKPFKPRDDEKADFASQFQASSDNYRKTDLEKDSFNFNQTQDNPIPTFTDNSQNPYKDEKAEKKTEKKAKVDMDTLVNGKQGYAPNPLLENPFEKNSKPKNFIENKGTDGNDKTSLTKSAKKSTPVEIDYNQIEQRRAKQELAEIYRELDESMKHQEKYTRMVGKIAVIIESYDRVVDYFEKIMSKVLYLNDVVIDIQTQQSKINKKINDSYLADEIEKLRTDFNDLYYQSKEKQRQTEEKQRQTEKGFREVLSKLEGLGVDAFGPGGGAREQIKRLERRMQLLEKEKLSTTESKPATNSLNQSKTKSQSEKLETNPKKYKSFFAKNKED